MIGKSDPNGNGRLALVLVDALLQKLQTAGVINDADIETLAASVTEKLEAEHSITSEGALSVLRSSKIGR